MKLFLALLLSTMMLTASAAPHRIHRRPRIRPPRPLRTVEVVRKIPWQSIAAGGAAAGTVIVAYKVSDGVEEGLKTVAKEKPEVFTDSLSILTRPFRWAILILLLCSGYLF